MKKLLAYWLAVYCLLVPGWAIAAPGEFSFGFIAHPFADMQADEIQLRETIDDTDQENLAFIVVGGIKSGVEPCSDQLYERRQAIMSAAKNGVMLLVAANDWSDCRYSNERSAAVERLNRIRELFFSGEFSLGASRLPLMRQSANPRFRDYSENTRWQVGPILFATLNLPLNNNRYLSAAGRNGEFEDRQVANRDWINRLFMQARHNKLAGIVIFCDGNPLARPAAGNTQRDGFAETRQQLIMQAAKFPGKVLLVHNQPLAGANASPMAIKWNDNLGSLALASGWMRVQVRPAHARLFHIDAEETSAAAGKKQK